MFIKRTCGEIENNGNGMSDLQNILQTVLVFNDHDALRGSPIRRGRGSVPTALLGSEGKVDVGSIQTGGGRGSGGRGW